MCFINLANLILLNYQYQYKKVPPLLLFKSLKENPNFIDFNLVILSYRVFFWLVLI